MSDASDANVVVDENTNYMVGNGDKEVLIKIPPGTTIKSPLMKYEKYESHIYDCKSDDRIWYTPSMLARRLGVSVSTLYEWRQSGNGPKFKQPGRNVFYTETDVAEWIENLESFQTTDESRQAHLKSKPENQATLFDDTE